MRFDDPHCNLGAAVSGGTAAVRDCRSGDGAQRRALPTRRQGRFAKRQQMQWTKRGAHLLLQTRTRTLDGTLRPLFERWYPGLANDNGNEAAQAAAA